MSMFFGLYPIVYVIISSQIVVSKGHTTRSFVKEGALVFQKNLESCTTYLNMTQTTKESIRNQELPFMSELQQKHLGKYFNISASQMKTKSPNYFILTLTEKYGSETQ